MIVFGSVSTRGTFSALAFPVHFRFVPRTGSGCIPLCGIPGLTFWSVAESFSMFLRNLMWHCIAWRMITGSLSAWSPRKFGSHKDHIPTGNQAQTPLAWQGNPRVYRFNYMGHGCLSKLKLLKLLLSTSLRKKWLSVGTTFSTIKSTAHFCRKMTCQHYCST